MRPIPTTTTSSLAPTSTSPSSISPGQGSTWHSPVPYLFGGLAAMLGLIAFALLILACSYWKLSGQQFHDDEESGNNNNSNIERKEEEGDSANKESVKNYEEDILVIMAGDEKPTFLATPASAMFSSSFTEDGVGNHSGKDIKNRETLDKTEKEMDKNHVRVQPTPQQQTQLQ